MFQTLTISYRYFSLGLAICLLAACGRQGPQYPVLTAQGDRVRIPIADVNDGGVHFFTYRHEGKNINFFVRRDSTGKLQTHFDACYSCYKYKLGYVRRENQVVCIACQIGYDLGDPVWDYIGACAPISLQSRIAGDHLAIRRGRLEKGGRFF